MSEQYKLLCEARELLGKASKKIVQASDYSGGHNIHLASMYNEIEELIEKMHDACGACPMEPKPRHTHEKLDKLAETIRRA